MKPTLPALSLLACLALAQGQPVAAQQLPAASAAAAVFLSAGQVAELLKAVVAKGSDPAVAPISVTSEYSISQVRRAKAGPPALHPLHNELHFILSGSATLVTGGVITKLPGQAESIVEGGVAHELKAGDSMVVPANTPHWYQKVDGEMTYLEVRFPAATGAPRAAAAP
jgi:mannose-6-phosphate isomerase-like protein (cupin superfamily)